jgi:hypothetical protein
MRIPDTSPNGSLGDMRSSQVACKNVNIHAIYITHNKTFGLSDFLSLKATQNFRTDETPQD